MRSIVPFYCDLLNLFVPSVSVYKVFGQDSSFKTQRNLASHLLTQHKSRTWDLDSKE